MTQTTNNIITSTISIIFMLLLSSTMVYFYNEHVNDKIQAVDDRVSNIKIVHPEFKWVDDGDNKKLMIKTARDWEVVPTQLLDRPRYYPYKNNKK